MRNLIRDRRGVTAFATIIALTPLIGVVALGGEAGSWYVTKQVAQNAADAAAYSGALRLECQLAGSCPDAQTVPYRGKEFAAQNAFCNAGDTSYPNSKCSTSLGKNVSQSVAINTLTSWNGVNGNFVQAIVSQTQPAYLSAILGLTSVTVGGQAIVQVQALAKPPCALTLTGSLSFQGSPNINAPNCDITSDDPANNSVNFTGGGMTISPGSQISAAGGCTGSSTFCSPVLTYMQPIPDPFSALDSVTMPTLSNCTAAQESAGGGLAAYSASTPCENNNVSLTGNTTITLSGGVYFISGTLTLKGTTAINGTALFILLPGASFVMKGTGTINVTANASLTNAQLPTALQPDASLLADMAFWDLDSSAIQIGGNSDINFAGNMYAPNAAVTFQGDPVINLAGGKGCGELIAASIAFNGNATFDDSGCPVGTTIQKQQYVQLIQTDSGH